MAGPSSSKIQDAYAMVADNERATLQGLRDAAAKFVDALDSAAGAIPTGNMPVTSALNNIQGWRGTAQMMLQNLDNLLVQYSVAQPDPANGP